MVIWFVQCPSLYPMQVGTTLAEFADRGKIWMRSLDTIDWMLTKKEACPSDVIRSILRKRMFSHVKSCGGSAGLFDKDLENPYL